MNTSRPTRYTLQGHDDESIFADDYAPPEDPKGTAIVVHGFKGYKTYGFFPYLCTQLADAGFRAICFNCSHSGMTNNTDTFERPDLFEKDTWGAQIADLLSVTRHAASDKPLFFAGHSRGGVTCLLTAARLAAPSKYGFDPSTLPQHTPAGIATFSAPADACRHTEADMQILRAEGRLKSPSGRTKQDLYVGKAWLDEIDANPSHFDPVLAASLLNAPLKVIHGAADTTVPPSDGRRIAEAAKTEPHIVPSANHVYNCPNPAGLDDAPPETRQMCAAIIEHFRSCRDKGSVAVSRR